MNRFSKGFIVLFLLFISLHSTALAHASAPFSDSFDSYSPGDLTGQGGWQSSAPYDTNTWRVTDQGCYGNTGHCVASNNVLGYDYKIGTDQASGEWQVYFYASPNIQSPILPAIEFNSAESIGNGVTDGLSLQRHSATSFDIYDAYDVVIGNIPAGVWHKIKFKWDMTDPTNCSFAVSVDNGADAPFTPASGDPTNCYHNIFADHTIGAMRLFSFLSRPNETYLVDSIGEEPATSTCASSCYSNVMFLPGIEGSRLFENSSSGERKLWESKSDSDALQLAMNPDGSSQNTIYTKQANVLDEVCVTDICPNIYKSFISEMNDLRDTQHLINDWEPISYDWRLDYQQLLAKGNKTSDGKISYSGAGAATSTPYIIQELKRLAANSRTKKVTLVTHSNGGLLAKALMQALGTTTSEQLIDKVIMVAAPQLGTPDTIGGILHGTAGIPFLISNQASRSIAQNLPGAYNLLPSNNYFTYVDDPVISFDSKTLPDWVSKYGSVVHSTDRLRAFMTDSSRTAPTYDDLNSPTISNAALFDASTAVHATLDKWLPPTGIKMYEVAGWGNDTTAGFEYKKVMKNTCLQFINGTCAGFSLSNELTFTPIPVVDGDGTVVVPSALWSNGASTTEYWLDLSPNGYNSVFEKIKTGRALSTSHKDMFEAGPLLNLIKDIVTSDISSTLPSYISTTQPVASPNMTRLHFVLHSPLTLGFIDSNGKYTGATATSSLFGAPDVNYKSYGDVQWLSIPMNLAGQVVMHGKASGSFSLDIEQTRGNVITTTTSFEGVPSSTSTVATININPAESQTASSTLVIDYNGDGVTDSTLNAKQGSVVLPDLTAPKTTLSISGTQGLNGWFVSNAKVTFSATDTESGVSKTFFSLDGAATTTGATTTITAEGIHTLKYYSTDNAGNVEQATSTIIKIDKTAPEATITVSTTTKDLIVTGGDNLSSTTIASSTTKTTITDQAGNITTLTFQKTYSNKLLTLAKLVSIQYGSSTPVSLPTSFTYIWNPLVNPPTLLSQTVIADNQFVIQGLYDKSKNKTSMIVLKKNTQIQSSTVTGLAVIKLTTNKGVINYGW